MNTIFSFVPRFSINTICSSAPKKFKEEILLILKLFGLKDEEIKYIPIDLEDWIESVIPLISLKKENLLNNTIIIAKEDKLLLTDNSFLSPNIEYDLCNLGINDFNNKEYKNKNIKIISKYYKIKNILFPDNYSNNTLIHNYHKLDLFKDNSGRKIHGVASLFDSDSYEYLIKLREDYHINKEKKSTKNIEYEELIKIISNAESCRSNCIERVLSDISKEQKEEEKLYFIKTINKKWARPIMVKKNSEPKNIFTSLMSIFGYEYSERINSTKDCILIQDFIPLRYEYRCIFVNKKLSTGGGCVEYFTPLDNDKCQFDYKVLESRGYSSYENINPETFLVERREDIVIKYIDFAKYIEEKLLLKEYEDISNFTLDLSLDEKGNVCIVELNAFENIGYYASNYDYILKDLINIS